MKEVINVNNIILLEFYFCDDKNVGYCWNTVQEEQKEILIYNKLKLTTTYID